MTPLEERPEQKEIVRLKTVLAESETRFSGIIDIAPDAIITIDDAHRILSFNPGAETIFGYGAAEVIGRPLDFLIPPQFREKHSRHVRDFGAAPEPSRMMSSDRTQVSGFRKDEMEDRGPGSLCRDPSRRDPNPAHRGDHPATGLL
jgi:PAS domain-containing protein